MNIPISKPFIGNAELKAIQAPLKSGWLTQGPEVSAFEQEFGEYTGAKYACAVSSCTAALFLALKTLGVGSGDEVITVSHSYIATANAIRYLGAIPVFVDIEPNTYNMNPKLIEAALSKKTKAILCVHQIGMPCDMNQIMPLAKRLNLPVVEDAACAIGSQIRYKNNWIHIGKPMGDIVCFSFHPRKVLTTGDGGMLTTNNRAFDKRFRSLRQHGMSVSDTARHVAKKVCVETYEELGYNYRMTDLQASIGRVQLKKINTIIRQRRKLANQYKAAFASNPGITPQQEPDWAKSNWQSYCVQLSKKINQKKIMTYLKSKGIASKTGIMCAHREPAYKIEPWKSKGLRISEYTQDHSILLPLFHELTGAQQKKVIRTLNAALV
ncbi:MAG: perosamine synthetase [Candidatus Omnitrophota bacterium]|jgi:perosamine synthetase